MIEFLPLFPSPVIKVNTNPEFLNIKDDLINFIYSEQKKDNIGIIRSNVGGWHSDVNLQLNNQFKKYIDFILNYLNKSCSPFFNEKTSINIMSCWANVNPKNSMNDWHTHPGSDMSGCLWIKTHNNCGNLIFNNPNEFVHDPWLMCLNHETKSKFLFSQKYFFSPVEGEIVLFPSNICHKVGLNESEEDRISIAFNIKFYDN